VTPLSTSCQRRQLVRKSRSKSSGRFESRNLRLTFPASPAWLSARLGKRAFGALQRVSHRGGWCYTRGVPTTRPRYTFTDTGDLEALLDAAQRRWPEVSDRKALLLRLAEEGGSSLGLNAERLDVEEQRKRAQAALERLRSLVDVDVLLSDGAWS